MLFVMLTGSKSMRGCDTFFHPVDERDKTWKSILAAIEYELENQYLENENRLPGIKFGIEITTQLPEDVELMEEE